MTKPMLIPVTIIDDSSPGSLRWPGTAALMPDGKVPYLLERITPEGPPGIFEREGDTPLGPFSPEVRVNDTLVERDAFDASWLNLAGRIYGLWFGYQWWVAERTAPGVFAPQVPIMTPPLGYELIEPTVCKANSTSYITYVKRLQGDPDLPWDVCVRRIGPGLVLGEEVVIEPASQGPYGQVRVTLSGAGVQSGLIAAWTGMKDAAGERPLIVSLSSDGGGTWGTPMTILDYAGHDIFNPFPLKLSNTDIRFYFAQGNAEAKCGYVQTATHGLTWTQHALMTQGIGAGYGRSWAFRVGSKSYVFVGVDKWMKLGVHELTT